jgi:hypothetical protein
LGGSACEPSTDGASSRPSTIAAASESIMEGKAAFHDPHKSKGFRVSLLNAWNRWHEHANACKSRDMANTLRAVLTICGAATLSLL